MSFFDRFKYKIWSNYLAAGDPVQTTIKIYAGILHKTPDSNTSWKVMDYRWFLPGSTLWYVGKASQFNLRGEVAGNYSIFELINPIVESSVTNNTHVSKGDYICVSPSDRKYIYRTKVV